MDFWIIEILDYWIIGFFDYWIIGFLKSDFWVFGSHNYIGELGLRGIQKWVKFEHLIWTTANVIREAYNLIRAFILISICVI